jgi:hypothetical protein
VAYIPDFEPLADALKRVMATGASEEEAKTDLCRAVADGKIRVRVRIATSHYKRGSVFSGGNVFVPAHLAPRDFDWARSRPIAQWRIGPRLGEHYFWDPENLPLDFIELWTADVAQVLCNRDGDELPPATSGRESAAIKALAGQLRADPKLKRSDAAHWCREHAYNLGKRAFDRVWPQAREKAGLPRNAAPGRKRKSPH